MLNSFCRLLLLAFPPGFRERLGRPLVQTLVTDSRTASGRLSVPRLIAGSLDIVRAGVNERWTVRRSASRGQRAPAPRRGLRGVVEDLHHVRRSLARRPVFAATVVLTLALGFAINTTIFSVVNAVLLRELPYRDPSRLAFMWTKLEWIGVPRAWIAGPHIELIRREATTVEAILPLRTFTPPVVIGGTPEVLTAGMTHAPLFDVLGVRPRLGRGFVTEDEPKNVAILSDELWRRSFGADPNVVGKSFDVASDRMEIIGVMPEDFRFVIHSSLGDPRPIDVWLPTHWDLAKMSDGSFGFAALVRVKASATLAQAQAELDVIGARLDRERYKSNGFGWQLTGVQQDLVKGARPAVLLLAAAAGSLLLIVAVNIAGLALVRQADRRREFVVRAALGAPRRQLIRLVLLECTTLSIVAGLAGLALTALGLSWLSSRTTLPLPRLAEVGIDWRVATFTAMVSTMCGLAFGIMPALRTTRVDPAHTLNDAARGSSGRTGGLRSLLVSAQVALAVVMVAAGVLLFRSYSAIRGVDPGFDGCGVLLATLSIDNTRYKEPIQSTNLMRAILDGMAKVGGVSALGATSSRPLQANTDQTGVRPDSRAPAPDGSSSILTDIIQVTPGYMRAMGIAITAGRDFTWDDKDGGQSVAIVDERFAKQAWPDGSAVGRTVSVDGSTKVTVVGVVRHARQYRIDKDDRVQLYQPFAQNVSGRMTLAIRASGDPDALVPSLRRVVADADPRQPITRITTMENVVGITLMDRRLQLQLVGFFGASALLLAALGVYGVLSSLVNERRREIGIRMALGATATSVRRLVLARVLVLSGGGLVVGLVAAVGLARVLDGFLFNVSARDPQSLAATAALMLATALVAAYLPVRRATAIDPTQALRD